MGQQQTIYKTSTDKKHSHIVYIRQDDTGITSKNNGHQHEIALDVQVVNSMDEQGNPVQQEKAAGWKVVPVENHTHKIEEVKLVEAVDSEVDDEPEVDTCYALYKQGMENYQDSLDLSIEAEEFYRGEQWDKTDKEALKKENRACLTINEMKPKLDMLSGYARQNRTDITLLPVEKGDATTTDIYNTLIKNILQQNNFDHEEIATFESQSRCGRGFMKVFPDVEKDITGEVKVVDVCQKKCFIGLHKKLDGSDAEYAGEYECISKAKLKELYPDKAEDIEKDFDYTNEIRDKGVVPERKADYYKRTEGKLVSLYPETDKELVDIAKQEYKIVTVFRKLYRRTPVFYNSKHNFYFNAAGLPEKDLASLKTIKELSFVNRTSYKIRETAFAGKTLLYSDISLFSEIPLVVFYANKIDEYFWGKIADGMDAQKEINKRHSQAIDIINKVARYGMGVTADAFESPGDYQKFSDNQGTPGFVAKFAPGFKDQIYEFQGVKYPNEIVAAMQLNSEKLSQILNVYPEMMGGQGRAESGVAIAQKMRQGLIGNEYLFDNFSLSKRRIGKLILDLIQKLYSPEKILRIVETQNNINTVKAGGDDLYPDLDVNQLISMAAQTGALQPQDAQMVGQMMQQGKPLPQEVKPILEQMQQMANQQRREQLMAMLSNKELTQFDAVISENTSTATMMLSNYILLSELASKGVPIPPAELIELMPNLSSEAKRRMVDGINQSQKASAEAESKKYDTEIQKSLIAAQSKSKQTGVPQGIA